MNKFKNFINKYVKYKNENKDNGIIKYCINDAYKRVIKLPFYKNQTFIYSDFDDSHYSMDSLSSKMEKIMITIYQYDYVYLHIYLYEEEDTESTEEDTESTEDELKIYLYMYDEDVLNKNIINTYDLCKYKYIKICQKYLFYAIHLLFYSIYTYYVIQLLRGININVLNILIIPFFHFFSETCILFFL